jgi:hypothetical protein
MIYKPGDRVVFMFNPIHPGEPYHHVCVGDLGTILSGNPGSLHIQFDNRPYSVYIGSDYIKPYTPTNRSALSLLLKR